jgi:hypothetical protein
MNYQEILEVLKNKLGHVSDFRYEAFDKHDLELGSIDKVASHGGENQGSDWWVVYNFEDHGVYIKVEGYYSSYNGTEFEDWDAACSEVKLKQKVVTVYE